MSQPDPPIAAERLWRLTTCPRCDYSLEGLPEIEICPECGEHYDQEFVVIRGKPIFSEDEPNGMVPGLPRFFFFAVQVGVITAFTSLRSVTIWTLPFWISPASVILVSLFFSFGRNPKTIATWMGASGIGQQSQFDPDSLAYRLTPIANFLALLLPCSMIFWLIADPKHGNNPLPALVFSSAGLLIMWTYQLAQRRRSTFRGQGVRPGLLHWTAYKTVEVQPLGDGLYRFRCTRSSTTRASEVVNIEITATSTAIQELCSMISTWSDHKREPILKPLKLTVGAKSARGAGSMLRRMFVGKSKRDDTKGSPDLL